MEIIIAVAVFGFGLWWIFLRTPADTTSSVPYKIETPPAPEPVVTPEPVVEEVKNTVEAVEGTITPVPVIATAIVESTETVKKPRKPRTPKVVLTEKSVAKKAAPKKAAAIKASTKKSTTSRSKKS